MYKIFNYNILELGQHADEIPDQSVQAIITSPPYFSKRDYGTAKFLGGDPNCSHEVGRFRHEVSDKQKSNAGSAGWKARDVCPHCGAVRQDAQLGQEKIHDCKAWAREEHPCGQCFVCNQRKVAKELWRILRDDGIFWLNLGDSFNGSGGSGGDYNEGGMREGQNKFKGANVGSLKPKDLMMIPSLVALALQTDGWYLRAAIPWLKSNVMPESATDRPTLSQEWFFMLTKHKQYFFDMESILIPNPKGELRNYRTMDGWNASLDALTQIVAEIQAGLPYLTSEDNFLALLANTSGFKGSHFATFPPQLITPLLLASTPPLVCAQCATPYQHHVAHAKQYKNERKDRSQPVGVQPQISSSAWKAPLREDLGWYKNCACETHATKPALVFDPFNGAGTTGLVALENGRDYYGTELNPEYITLTHQRLKNISKKLF